MKHHVAVYLENGELTEFKREAARRRISLSRYLKERLLESADAVPQPGAAAAPADEKALDKIVRTAVLRELKPLAGQLNLLTAMLDQFALSVLINLPELAEAQRQSAITAGRRRHQGWRTAVSELMEEGLPQHSAAGAEA
jgi:hypothetical protein